MSDLYPGSFQIPIMKYNGHPAKSVVDKAFNGTEYLAQEKKDGAIYMLEKIDSEHIYLFARTVSKKTGELVEKSANVPHIVEWAKKLPNRTVLLGEMYVDGGHSNDVTKIMGCLPSNAFQRQFKTDAYGGPVHYYVFDCLYYAGKKYLDSGFEQRYNIIKKFFVESVPDKYVELAENYESDFTQHLSRIYANGGEGMVFKKKSAVYEPGKRPTTTYFKMKEHIDSLDLICIGLEDPVKLYTGKDSNNWPYWWNTKSNRPCGVTAPGHYWDSCMPTEERGFLQPVTKPFYFGWKNAMRLGCYKDGKIVEVGRVASGLTDELRSKMSKYPNDYLNKVIQVSCMSVNKKDGTIRHPVFECMREDKNIEDCLWSEIFNG